MEAVLTIFMLHSCGMQISHQKSKTSTFAEEVFTPEGEFHFVYNLQEL